MRAADNELPADEGLNAIESFFESLRGHIQNQSTAGSEVSIGAFNGLGIFASSLAADERMKETLKRLTQPFIDARLNEWLHQVQGSPEEVEVET